MAEHRHSLSRRSAIAALNQGSAPGRSGSMAVGMPGTLRLSEPLTE